MLVVKVFINERQIDEIYVQNVDGEPWRIWHRYKVRKPKGYDGIEIKHDRSSGYRPLLKKVLKILGNKEWKKAR